MSFTPEQQAFLREMFEGHTKTVNDTLNGFAKRFTGSVIPEAIDAKLNPIAERLNGFSEESLGKVVSTQFSAMLEELAKQEQAAATEPGKAGAAGGADDPALAELRAQLEKTQKDAEDARKLAQEERKIRQKLAEDSRIQGLDNAVLDALRGKVKAGTERELLTLLKAGNLLQEDKENNRFVVEMPDEYGIATRKPATEAIADLIAQRYSHYQELRPGTGTGGSPQTTQIPAGSGQRLNYFQPNDQGQLTIDDNKLDSLSLGDLDKALSELGSVTATSK